MIIEDADPAIEARARRAAKRIGLRACKGRGRIGPYDNYGGFRVIDPDRNWIVWGEKYNLTAEEVIELCAQRGA